MAPNSNRFVATAACLLLGSLTLTTAAGAQTKRPAARDPRVGLKSGWQDAGWAARGMAMVAHHDPSETFMDRKAPGDFRFANADLAFSGHYAFQGSYHGFQIWDITDATHPKVRTAFPCPGGQGDPSVYGNLLFISVEETRGRIDCGSQGVADTVSAERFRGVRIFDISDLDHPKQVAAVQTCRGSHTHTLVTDPRDAANIYVYVSGTSDVRPGAELAGCSDKSPAEDPNTSLFRIEVIQVPLAAPEKARVVNSPRLFADATGKIDALWKGGAHGAGTQETSEADQCHDITVYPDLGIGAGACSGNGLLLDISTPSNPKRIAEVSDPNFAYWHSATFSNDGSKLLFTDEWGGGVGAKCRATDRKEWGADAIYTVAGNTLNQASFYKLPAAQTEFENCVAHNGSLVPVPGRDIFVQAWYQGGISVMDFTDAAHPKEIAFFDRGPMFKNKPSLAGFWSAYWYNGHIIGSEIARGLDILDLVPSAFLTRNEIDAARSVQTDRSNPQLQTRIVWPANFAVARAYVDQLVRGKGLKAGRTVKIAADLRRAELQKGEARARTLTSLAADLARDADGAADGTRVRALEATVSELSKI